jgi:hypothetical protein
MKLSAQFTTSLYSTEHSEGRPNMECVRSTNVPAHLLRRRTAGRRICTSPTPHED